MRASCSSSFCSAERWARSCLASASSSARSSRGFRDEVGDAAVRPIFGRATGCGGLGGGAGAGSSASVSALLADRSASGDAGRGLASDCSGGGGRGDAGRGLASDCSGGGASGDAGRGLASDCSGGGGRGDAGR